MFEWEIHNVQIHLQVENFKRFKVLSISLSTTHLGYFLVSED